MKNTERLDAAVFAKGLAESREKAKALVMAGCVYVNGGKALKAGQSVSVADEIELRNTGDAFVSRGAYKLQKALDVFGLDPEGLVCVDVGASTGGFTHLLLERSAAKVYAVDVGYGQLAWRLRNDARVVNLERTNFRNIESGRIPEPVDFACVDVSFISLKLILPTLRQFLKESAKVVCLVKPQFEAGRGSVGKKGVVRDAQVHRRVLTEICDFCFVHGFGVLGADYSPIKGPQGNIEFLLLMVPQAGDVPFDAEKIESAVTNAHLSLNGE